LLSSLIHLCWSINHFPSITAWEHIFVPREYLVPHLEELFMRSIIDMLQYNHETSEIARPSEVLHSIRAFMSALRSIELHGECVICKKIMCACVCVCICVCVVCLCIRMCVCIHVCVCVLARVHKLLGIL